MTTVTIKFESRKDAVKARSLLLDLSEKESLLKASLFRSLLVKCHSIGQIEGDTDDLTLNLKAKADLKHFKKGIKRGALDDMYPMT